MVVSGGFSSLPLTIPLKTHLHLFFNALSVARQLLLLLALELLKVAPVLALKVDLVLFYLVAEQVLRKQLDLLLDVT